MLTTKKLKLSGIQRLSHQLTLNPLLRMQLLLLLRSYLPTLFQCVSIWVHDEDCSIAIACVCRIDVEVKTCDVTCKRCRCYNSACVHWL